MMMMMMMMAVLRRKTYSTHRVGGVRVSHGLECPRARRRARCISMTLVQPGWARAEDETSRRRYPRLYQNASAADDWLVLLLS